MAERIAFHVQAGALDTEVLALLSEAQDALEEAAERVDAQERLKARALSHSESKPKP
jgi:hypothetical protein